MQTCHVMGWSRSCCTHQNCYNIRLPGCIRNIISTFIVHRTDVEADLLELFCVCGVIYKRKPNNSSRNFFIFQDNENYTAVILVSVEIGDVIAQWLLRAICCFSHTLLVLTSEHLSTVLRTQCAFSNEFYADKKEWENKSDRLGVVAMPQV